MALRALGPLQSSSSIPATHNSSLFSLSYYSAKSSTSASYSRPNLLFNSISCRRLSYLNEESHGPAAVDYGRHPFTKPNSLEMKPSSLQVATSSLDSSLQFRNCNRSVNDLKKFLRRCLQSLESEGFMQMKSSSTRQRTLGPGVQYLLDYLKIMQSENPGFFYASEGDNELSGNVLWSDASSRANYSYFSDTVRVDTSYSTNRSKIPFVTFTGINHHAEPLLFGFALLLNESDTSFIWLLQTWLCAMSGHVPVSVTSDPDRLIQMVVAQVLPQARNRFCRWSIFRQTQEKLANVYQVNPTFNFELKKCVNEADTVEEFESCWANLLNRHYLMNNEWLLSLYNVRDQWVPVYLKDVFLGSCLRWNAVMPRVFL